MWVLDRLLRAMKNTGIGILTCWVWKVFSRFREAANGLHVKVFVAGILHYGFRMWFREGTNEL